MSDDARGVDERPYRGPPALGPTTKTFDPTALVGPRIGALCIDIGLLLLFCLAAIIPFVAHRTISEALRLPECHVTNPSPTRVQCTGHLTFQSGNDITEVNPISAGACGVFGVIQFCVVPGLTGASFGKRFVGIRVVNANGSPIGVLRSFVRTLLLLTVDGIWTGFACGLVLCLTARFHQRLGDMMIGSFVVRKEHVGRPILVAGGHAGPVWDAARGAYLQWDPVFARWAEWDPVNGVWR